MERFRNKNGLCSNVFISYWRTTRFTRPECLRVTTAYPIISSLFRCRYNLRRHVNIVLYTISGVSSLFLFAVPICNNIGTMPMNRVVAAGMTLKYSKNELCNNCHIKNIEVY